MQSHNLITTTKLDMNCSNNGGRIKSIRVIKGSAFDPTKHQSMKGKHPNLNTLLDFEKKMVIPEYLALLIFLV